MSTCKDCVHCKVCETHERVNRIKANLCGLFKNKADFVEVKKAKWIYETRCYNCSVCGGKRFNLLLGTDAEYCPYCGAKMIFDEKEGANNG